MNEEMFNKTLMLSVFRAFKDGDLDPLFAALSDEIVWQSNSPREFFRFGGTHRGRAGMKEFTSLLLSRYHIIRFDPKIVVAKGDVVWGQFEAEARHLPTGRIARSDFSIRWIVQDRKIIEHQGFFDTASVLMQQGQLVAA